MKKFYVFIFAISILLCTVISSTSSAEETAKFQKAVSNKSTAAPANQKLNPLKVMLVLQSIVSHSADGIHMIAYINFGQNLNQNSNYKKYKECCKVVVKFNTINTKPVDYDFKILESSGNKDIDEFTISILKKYRLTLGHPVSNKGYITVYYNCPLDAKKHSH